MLHSLPGFERAFRYQVKQTPNTITPWRAYTGIIALDVLSFNIPPHKHCSSVASFRRVCLWGVHRHHTGSRIFGHTLRIDLSACLGLCSLLQVFVSMFDYEHMIPATRQSLVHHRSTTPSQSQPWRALLGRTPRAYGAWPTQLLPTNGSVIRVCGLQSGTVSWVLSDARAASGGALAPEWAKPEGSDCRTTLLWPSSPLFSRSDMLTLSWQADGL